MYDFGTRFKLIYTHFDGMCNISAQIQRLFRFKTVIDIPFTDRCTLIAYQEQASPQLLRVFQIHIFPSYSAGLVYTKTTWHSHDEIDAKFLFTSRIIYILHVSLYLISLG